MARPMHKYTFQGGFPGGCAWLRSCTNAHSKVDFRVAVHGSAHAHMHIPRWISKWLCMAPPMHTCTVQGGFSGGCAWLRPCTNASCKMDLRGGWLGLWAQHAPIVSPFLIDRRNAIKTRRSLTSYSNRCQMMRNRHRGDRLRALPTASAPSLPHLHDDALCAYPLSHACTVRCACRKVQPGHRRPRLHHTIPVHRVAVRQHWSSPFLEPFYPNSYF